MFSKTGIEAYFTGEKAESLLFTWIGAASVLIAIICYVGGKTSVYKGLAYPLLLVGLIQFFAGYTVYRRSDEQRKDIVYKMDMNPSAIRDTEIPRMQKVMKQFVVLQWVELLLLIIGVLLVIAYRFLRGEKKERLKMFYGIGIALSVQSLVMLVADHIAQERGSIYLNGIQSLFGN